MAIDPFVLKTKLRNALGLIKGLRRHISDADEDEVVLKLLQELNVAEQAHEALNTLSTIQEVINALSRARDKAEQAVTSLSSEEALNNSRHEVVIASNDLIRSLQSDLSAPDKIEKARRAVEDWVRELKALQA
jgi:hypothetical protein